MNGRNERFSQGVTFYGMLAVVAIAASWLMSSSSTARGQFVRGNDEAKLRRLIPLAEYRDDPKLLIYTHATMPPVYQFHQIGGPTGAHTPSYNISMDKWIDEPYGNGNFEFPWGKPGGFHRSKNARDFFFLKLPGQPVVHWKEGHRYVWMFPIGTVIGEVVTIRGPDKLDYPVEVRTRRRDENGWRVGVHRPFPTPQHLIDAIKLVRPQWQTTPELVAIIGALENPPPMVTRTLADRHPDLSAFKVTANVDTLPALPSDLSRDLLTQFGFDDATGVEWRPGCGGPTTEQLFSVVAHRNDNAYIGTTDESCARCHATVGMHVDNFDFYRDWYGYVRGSDRIFSFHPFHPSCISDSGFHIDPRFREIAGVIEPFNPQVHTPEHYRRLLTAGAAASGTTERGASSNPYDAEY